MQIRPALAGDIPRLMEIEASAAELFRAWNLFEMTDMEVIDASAHAAGIAAGLSLVAEIDGEVAGFAIGEWQDSDAHLLELDVDLAFQRRGIGRRLLDAFREAASRKGAPAVWLSTFRDPPWNAPFYRRCGFMDVAKRDYPAWVRELEADQAADFDLATRVVMRRTL